MLPIQRQDASATYPAGLQVIGLHTRLVIAADGDWVDRPTDATHIMIQTELASIRITFDETLATATKGFVISNSPVTSDPILHILSVSGSGVSIFSVAGGSIIQYQWLG